MEFQPVPCENKFFWKSNFLNLISEGCIFNYSTEEMAQSKSISKSTVPAYVYF